MARPVDAAWVNGRVFTGSGFAEGFLIEGGVVQAVGPDDAVRRAKGAGSEVVDLRGRLVLPGLVDLHMHLSDTVLGREAVDVRGTRSKEEIADRLRERVVPGSAAPVIGFGWDSSLWRPPGDLTRGDLDRLSTEQPVVLFQVSTHAAVLNSTALAALGVDEGASDPPGGYFGRDRDGRLNGLVVDEAMSGLASKVLDRGRHRSVPAGYRSLLEGAAALGLTTLCPVTASPEEIRIVSTLPRDAVPVRLRFYLDLRRLADVTSLAVPEADALWRVNGVKAVTDGAFGTRTAWLDAPYSDAPTTSGFPIWDDRDLEHALRQAMELGLPPALHAIGDRAIRRVLDVLSRVETAGPARIEHASLTPPSLWPMLEKTRPHLVVQPHFVVTDSWAVTRLGPERARWTYAFRTLGDRGFRLGGSSDSPVEPLDPWTGLRAAVFRAPRSEFGRYTAGERLAPIEAFQLYTRNAGTILGEPSLGTLAVDSPGDFVITSSNSLDAALASDRPPVVETWVGGRRAFPSASS